MRNVIIMRGPSGCGKSTWIQENAPDAIVVSADHFFEHEISNAEAELTRNPLRKVFDENEHIIEYRFNPTKLGEAHASCLRKFIGLLSSGAANIVVDNTNVHLWEYENYVLLAKQAGCKVRIVEFRPTTIEQLNLCAKRNTHKVPIEYVAKMCYEFEHDETANVQVIV